MLNDNVNLPADDLRQGIDERRGLDQGSQLANDGNRIYGESAEVSASNGWVTRDTPQHIEAARQEGSTWFTSVGEDDLTQIDSSIVPPRHSDHPSMRDQKRTRDQIVTLLTCSFPLFGAFAGLFLPYFTETSAEYPFSVSLWDSDSNGPYFITIVAIMVALVPLVLQLFLCMGSRLVILSSSLVGFAGITILGTVTYHWSPSEGNLLDFQDLGWDRGIGFWLLFASGIALVLAGIAFTVRAGLQAQRSEQAENQKERYQPTTYASFTGSRGSDGSPQGLNNVSTSMRTPSHGQQQWNDRLQFPAELGFVSQFGSASSTSQPLQSNPHITSGHFPSSPAYLKAPITQYENPPHRQSGNHSTVGTWLKGICLLLVVGFLGFVVFSDPGLTGNEAEVYCQSRVKEHLKDPGSADFRRSTVSTKEVSEGLYRVSGVVFANNSFGGKVATNYSCSVMKRDNGDIRVSVSVD